MLELKQYQENTIEVLENFCKAISNEGERGSAEKCLQAWDEMIETGKYKTRHSKSYKNIPSVCLKIPTGGGKTLLGIKSIQTINREYMKRNTGLVVWIVPTDAIYKQTLKGLKDYDHPYRQELDRIAPNRRVKIKEKKEKIHLAEVENDLVVLLLMLQSATQRKGKKKQKSGNIAEEKGFLKMYQEDSKYQEFFPDSSDILKTKEILKKIKNLTVAKEGEFKINIVSSLGNVLKICQPLIIVDEAHKADSKSRKALDSINDMNPSFLLELTATPSENSNVLVDISGAELKKESMIKLPIELKAETNTDWKDIVNKSIDKLKELEELAEKSYAETGRYIRPINLIRVESTGNKLIGKGSIHAQDVKKYLIENMKYTKEEVKIKSSDVDELGNEDLLSDISKVKIIITKDALKEGWDCSFAYILTILDNAKSATGLTQMLGRVLRQPHAREFAIEELNRAYVFCLNPNVRKMVGAIEEGLKNEGLEDAKYMINPVIGDDLIKHRQVEMRDGYRGRNYVIPKIFIKESEEGSRLLEYERDILSHICWKDIKAPTPSLPLEDKSEEVKVEIDLGEENKVKKRYIYSKGKITAEEIAFQINDIILNTWQAMRIGRDYIAQLTSHTEEQQYNNKQYYISQIRDHIKAKVDEEAEEWFKKEVGAGKIYLNLDAKHCKWRIPEKIPKIIRQSDDELIGDNGKKIQKSLFNWEIKRDYNNYEEDVAVYLDKAGREKAIEWWHRVAKRQEFGIQGWRKHLIYPDFLMLGNTNNYIYLETKGDQLKELEDTKMKERLFEILSTKNNVGKGSLKCQNEVRTVGLRIIYQEEWNRGERDISPQSSAVA